MKNVGLNTFWMHCDCTFNLTVFQINVNYQPLSREVKHTNVFTVWMTATHLIWLQTPEQNLDGTTGCQQTVMVYDMRNWNYCLQKTSQVVGKIVIISPSEDKKTFSRYTNDWSMQIHSITTVWLTHILRAFQSFPTLSHIQITFKYKVRPSWALKKICIALDF